MSTEDYLHLWVGIAAGLALCHLVSSYLWCKVTIKIVALKTRIQELEAEIRMYRSPR